MNPSSLERTRPPRAALLCATLAVGAATFGAYGNAIASERSAQQIYEKTCSACHATGVANAPKWADHAAWKPLIEEGQAVLTAHAWVGVRAMPPRGGDPNLSLEEFARAVAYMARSAGADWKDPDDEMLEEIREEEEDRIEALRDAEASDD